MSDRSFFVWSHRIVGNACTLKSVKGFEDEWKFYAGMPLAKDFPSDVALGMDAARKKNVRLTDSLYNMIGAPIISKRLADFLRANEVPGLEFLPVAIINHKDQVASTEYTILNPCRPVDALDKQASRPRYNEIIPTDISRVERLVLDVPRIPPEMTVFRLKEYTIPLLVDKRIADEITNQGFDGIYFTPLHQYQGV